MRLICPNCDAQYEVPDNVIPAEGRDVQCSDCGNTWFQEPASAQPALAEPGFDRPPVPPEVSSILQEEAELERAARNEEHPPAADPADAEPEPSGPEVGEDTAAHPFVGPDPGETDQDRRAREARERMARMRSVAEADPFEAAGQSRKSALPDVDELNSSLHVEGVSAYSGETLDVAALRRKERRAAGFRNGFALVIFTALVGLALYTQYENIGRALPVAQPVLENFVAWVNDGRLWLDGQATIWQAQLNDLLARQGG